MRWVSVGLAIALLIIALPVTIQPAQAEVSAETMVDVLRRLDYLEKKSRELQGENEVLRHEIDKQKKLQKEGFLHVDDRLEAMNKRLQAVKKVVQGQSSDGHKAPAGKDDASLVSKVGGDQKVKVTKPEAGSNSATGPKQQTAESEKSAGINAVPENSVKTMGKTTSVTLSAKSDNKLEQAKQFEGDKKDTQPATRAPTKYEKETYQAAYKKMKQSPTAATQAFEEYIKMQPNSPLAANAQYWIGEIKYSHNNYKGAVEEFIKVLQNYKYSEKAPDAAVKLGYSFYALKNWAYARRTFEDVLKYFPDNQNAVSLAKKRLTQLDAAGH